ncbi:46025_t:CDS:2, partial [Gigaspora margarita]
MVWLEFCLYFLEELLVCNILWFLNQNAGLAYIEPNNYYSKYQLNTTFELRIVEDMKRRYGYPSDEMSNSLLLLIKQIYNEQVVSKMLKDAINKSFYSGYHQVLYMANKLYFIRYKNELQIPSPICWNENSEEVKKLLTYGYNELLSFNPSWHGHGRG